MPALVARCLAYARQHYPAYDWHGALVNLYVDGTDKVDEHSDDESGLAPGAPILSFSFGATRRFVVRPKKDHTEVPRMTKTEEAKYPVGPRINITVRSFVIPGSSAGAVKRSKTVE